MAAGPPAPWTGALPAFGIPLLLLLGAGAMLVRVRALALRAPADDAAAVWFAFARRSGHLVLGGWLAWTAALSGLGTSRFLDYSLIVWPHTVRSLAGYLLYALPPLALTVTAAALSHAVARRMRGVEWTMRELVSQSALASAMLLVPIACFVVSLSPGHLALRARLLLDVAGVATFMVLAARHRQAMRFELNALTVGTLRDRAFALAARAKVKLHQIYVLPMSRGRIANAFAMRGNNVLFTDYLLAHLTRREVDGVIAHELAHLGRNHLRILSVGMLLACGFAGGVAYAITGPTRTPLALVVGVIGAIAIQTFIHRRLERSADAGAVALTGDAEGLISGLARLNRLNHVPLEWGRWDGKLITHPSTLQRARAIAAVANIPEARWRELLKGEGLGNDHYQPPATAHPMGKVMSTAFKHRSAVRLGLLLSLVSVAAPTAIAMLSREFPALRGGLVAWSGFAVSFVLFLVISDRIAARPYARLERALRDHFARAGVDVVGRRMVGFAPDRAHRVYEYSSDWDMGFLLLGPDHLSYAGEEVRFTLRREQIRQVRLGEPFPGWLRQRRVWVTWVDAEGTIAGFSLRPGDMRRVRDFAAVRRLRDALIAWREEGTGARRTPPNFGPPHLGAVTSVPARSLATPRVFIRSILEGAILGFVGAALAGLIAPGRGLGASYVVLAAAGTRLLNLLPYAFAPREMPAPAQQVEPVAEKLAA